MRKIIAIALFTISASVLAQPYPHKIIKVVDGDTVQIEAPFLPKPLKPVLALRLSGLDTPEKFPKAKCAKEAILAAKASEYTQKIINKSQNIVIFIENWDKYGGRVLGRITVDGKDLSRMIIDNGLGREYNGKAKSNWCL